MGLFIELANSRIHYDEAGQGSAVLLLHGLGLDLRMWDEQMPALAGQYRAIRMDLHGCGKSSAVTAPFSHAAIISEFLQRLDVARAHIVGLSLGGALAAELVQEHPEQARSLTLVDSDMGGMTWKTLGPSVGKVFSAGKTDLQAAKELWIAHEFFDGARKKPAVIARIAEMVRDYSGWQFQNAGSGMERKPQPRAAEVLKDFALPTLVIVGELDLPDFRDIADEVAKRIPGARKVVLAGVGHMSSMEDPATFNRTLLDFLATVP
jgi:3-oxoadipate enol-lactonase